LRKTTGFSILKWAVAGSAGCKIRQIIINFHRKEAKYAKERRGNIIFGLFDSEFYTESIGID
jgi:hypothetical protein